MGRKSISLSNNTYVTIEWENARFMKIYPLASEEERNIENDIIKLNYNKEFKVEISEELILDKQIYKPFRIQKVDSIPGSPGYYMVFNYDTNKSTNFIMPLLTPSEGITKKDYSWKDFCNCYIGTEKDGEYGNYIYLLYRYNGSRDFIDFEKAIMTYQHFVDKENVDNFHSLYKFEIPPNMINDYQLILAGKYSQISEFSKKQILDFYYLLKDSPTYKILHRDIDRKKEMEKDLLVKIPEGLDLYSCFTIEQEIYMEKYKIKTNIYDRFREENPNYC